MQSKRQLIHAAAIIDAECRHEPGALLVQGGAVIAAGSPQTVGHPESVELIDAREAVVLPGLVNTHAHLDLTHLDPAPYEGDFVAWINMVRAGRASHQEQIRASVTRGAELARAGGTALIGDIAGGGLDTATESLRSTGLAGVSFLEVFGLGKRQATAAAGAEALLGSIQPFHNGVRVGLQPHAPYSCGQDVYRLLARDGVPMATHLAETPEEIQFTQTMTGPLVALLTDLGVWDETIVPTSKHPVELIAPLLEPANPVVAAHLNYVEPHHLQLLIRCRISVAYCPRASAYFGHPKPGHSEHQYSAMLATGVNVALGTDSLLCLDTPDRISPLDEMRFLSRRDGTDPTTLIRMATVNGARALGFDEDLVRFSPGPVLGAVSVECGARSSDDPVRSMLKNSAAPTWIVEPWVSDQLECNARGVAQACRG